MALDTCDTLAASAQYVACHVGPTLSMRFRGRNSITKLPAWFELCKLFLAF
jgi:hypothetical protein